MHIEVFATLYIHCIHPRMSALVYLVVVPLVLFNEVNSYLSGANVYNCGIVATVACFEMQWLGEVK